MILYAAVTIGLFVTTYLNAIFVVFIVEHI